MPDKFSREVRSRIMSRIKSKNTKPELMLKKALKGSYLRYQPKVCGKPDFASKKRKVAIFIDGCFWHKCPKCYRAPKSNKKYWLPKIEGNVQRAREVTKQLRNDGWKVLRFWEHEIKSKPKKCSKKIYSLL